MKPACGWPALPWSAQARWRHRDGRVRPGARRAGAAGDSLLEVLVALLLLALAALGTVALQSGVARSQQSARWLDLAVSAAALVAEAWRAGESAAASVALADSTTRALPDGQVNLMPLAEGQWRLTVGWTEPPRWGAASGVGDAAAGAGGAGDYGGAVALPCPTAGAAATAGRVPHCLALVLVR